MSPVNSIAGQIPSPLTLSPRKLDQMPGAAEAQKGASSGGVQSFGKALNNFVTEVDNKIKVSGDERTKVLAGETTNLHQAMIASQEASVSFTFMVELRNKLVESYQELMRSQV